MVTGSSYKAGSEGQTRKWKLRFYWHPQCWIDQGVARLDRVELQVTEAKRGRKSLQLSPEDRTARIRILARRARVVQRLQGEMRIPEWQENIDRIIKLGSQVEKLKEEIIPLGGIPKSWV